MTQTKARHPAAGTRAARAGKSTQVSIRIEPGQLATIDAAAAVLGGSRTAFMLETAMRAAEDVLLDKRLFAVDDETYRRFLGRLDTAPADNPKLNALLHSSAPWEA